MRSLDFWWGASDRGVGCLKMRVDDLKLRSITKKNNVNTKIPILKVLSRYKNYKNNHSNKATKRWSYFRLHWTVIADSKCQHIKTDPSKGNDVKKKSHSHHRKWKAFSSKTKHSNVLLKFLALSS